MPFLVAGILTLVNWIYGFLILPESLKPEHQRPFCLRRANPIGALLELRRHRLVLGLSVSYFISSLAHQVYPSIWVLYTSYRYGWGTRQTGLSLALVGLMTVVVQGGLAHRLIPRLGERRAALFGFAVMAAALTGYGLAPEGWIVYPLIVFGSLSGLAVPSIQGMISRSVGADEQGGIQGSLTSLQSVAGAVGPPLATAIFGFFIRENASVILPGAPFFFSSGLAILAGLLAARSFRRCPSGEFREMPQR